jgi:predicted O-methyltransferase YrrM
MQHAERAMVMKELFYGAFAGLHRRQAVRRVRVLEKKLLTPTARFAIPFVYRGGGFFKKIEPRQNIFEIEALFRAVLELSPKRVLEIGTARGGTLYLWTQAASADATIVSIDLPGGAFGGAYPTCRVPFYQSFARPGQHLHLLRTDSHAPETVHQVQSIFGPEPADFAFIDGDHTYEGVKSDFQLYGPLVRTGGIIAFHDIFSRPDSPDIQVDRFWNEIKRSYPTEEIVGPPETGRQIGIGIIHVT